MSASSTKQDAAKRHFDRHAGRYSSLRGLRSLQGRALEALEIQAGDELLDVACGAGSLLFEAAPRGAGRLAGLDLAEGMLVQARERAAAKGVELELHHGSAGELPFADASFTKVVTTSASHHFPDPDRAFAEMTRVLRPGGRLVVGDFCGDPPPMKLLDLVQPHVEKGHVRYPRRGELVGRLEGTGLRVRRARRVLAGFWVLVTADKP